MTNTDIAEVNTKYLLKERVKRFYDIGSPYYHALYGNHIHDGYYITGKESREKAQENLVKYLAYKAKIQRGAKVLDVGCGIGGSSIWLAKNLDALTTGITISPVQVEIASKLARESDANSRFLLMDAEQMYFSEEFDAIWLVAALTHFQNQDTFLRSTTRFLKRNGKLVLFDWTVNDDLVDTNKDSDINLIIKGMVLSGMYSDVTYMEWLTKHGYHIWYEKDISKNTVKTWDAAITLLKKQVIWKLALRVARERNRDIFKFLQCIKAMKIATEQGKVKASVIISEKV